MKNYSTEEIAIATKRAFHFIYSTQNCLLHKSFKYDRRTRIGHLANQIVIKNQLTSDAKRAIMLLRKERALVKKIIASFGNYTQNKIYLDYKRNGATAIYSDRLCNSGRNHWAKTEADRKVLQVLRNNFMGIK